jgi:hypothetical protein
VTPSLKISLRSSLLCGLLVLGGASVSPAEAYSVLAHQAIIDAAWDDAIVPLLRQRYPGLTPETLNRARAFAYGGSVIQDLGYYPFGSKRFTNLVHYVRSGDFVEALIVEAQSPEELAFALGGLAHYACDNFGHPLATNRVVPMMYPKVREKVGERAIYADSPARHVMVEFAFDVLHVAGTAYSTEAYRQRIGFEVSKPLLERAFRATYGLELKDLFGDEDLAIGTYRHAIGTVIPEMTRLAWEDKQDEIRQRTPGAVQQKFVFSLTPAEYDKDYGTNYQKPGFFTRVLFYVLKIVPKIGPFRPLAFEPLTPEAEKLFVQSFDTARERYRGWVIALRKEPLSLANSDLDTGQPPDPSTNPLLAETTKELNELRTERVGSR